MRMHAPIAAYPRVVAVLSLPGRVHSPPGQPLDVKDLEEVGARNRAVPVDVGVFDEQPRADIAIIPIIREPPVVALIVVDIELL